MLSLSFYGAFVHFWWVSINESIQIKLEQICAPWMRPQVKQMSNIYRKRIKEQTNGIFQSKMRTQRTLWYVQWMKEWIAHWMAVIKCLYWIKCVTPSPLIIPFLAKRWVKRWHFAIKTNPSHAYEDFAQFNWMLELLFALQQTHSHEQCVNCFRF